ncbi:MAG TPA: alpha-L-fucosidase [Candidatus Hydrogenedentes bacterium]|mgnify:CR=1 FL=1|nr:alpha-L-fucosidase [Candidatus Hydrogenedentota bacterium]
MSNLDWFHEARYGMFIHWGAYAVAARGEWVLNRELVSQDEYVQKYVRNFKAERYDPGSWARLAKSAGMKYVVLTTRHHDGFCLWDSKVSDYNAARLGPGRDLLRPFVEAVRAEGLKVGFYYSVADWHHPDYPGAYARDWPTDWPDEAARKRFVDYYIAQLEELLTQYGKVDILWYDGCIPQPTDGRRANELARKLQPHILISERNGEPFDFRVSEQSLTAKEGAWEANLTLNDNWGYHAGDHHWKTAQDVIRMLTTTARSGGNLMLNVGPRADGTIPEDSARILTEAGQWLARNREFLPNSTRSPFSWNNCSTLTTRGNVAYVHLFASPGKEYCLAEIANRVLSARFLDGGQPVPFEQKGDRLFLRGLPCPLKDPIATTLALELDGPPRPVRAQKTFWIPG